MKVGDKVNTRYYGPGTVKEIRGEKISVTTKQVMMGRNCVILLDVSEVIPFTPPLINPPGAKRPWTINKKR